MSGLMGDLASWINVHSEAVLVALIILVVLLVVCWLGKKSGFMGGLIPQERSLGNLYTYGLNPQWYWGANDAGNWGSMHRTPPLYQAKYYDQGIKAWVDPDSMTGITGCQSRVPEEVGMNPFTPGSGIHLDAEGKTQKEGFTGAEARAAWGQPDGLADMNWLKQGPCGFTDIGAAAEVAALTSMGCYSTMPYGAGNFAKMVEASDTLKGVAAPDQLQYNSQMTGGF